MDKSISESAPFVSICIPTYNRAEKLKRAVDTLLASSYNNLEIIISDNASSDDTEKLCNKMLKSDYRIKYYRHKENMGPTKNFEFVRTKATGKYFFWHGDDDHIDPDYITNCITTLENDPSLILASGVAAYITDKGKLARYGKCFSVEEKSPTIRVIKYLMLVTENSIFCGAYRREKVLECSMPDCLAGDWVWMCEVLTKGKARMNSETNIYREFENSTSSSPREIVLTIGAPNMQSLFPAFFISRNVSIFFSDWLLKQKKTNKLYIYLFRFFIFTIVIIKELISNLRLKLIKIAKSIKI